MWEAQGTPAKMLLSGAHPRTCRQMRVNQGNDERCITACVQKCSHICKPRTGFLTWLPSTAAAAAHGRRHIVGKPGSSCKSSPVFVSFRHCLHWLFGWAVSGCWPFALWVGSLVRCLVIPHARLHHRMDGKASYCFCWEKVASELWLDPEISQQQLAHQPSQPPLKPDSHITCIHVQR